MINGVARWPLTHIQPQKFFELFFHRHGFKRAGCTCAVDNACGWALLYKQIPAWICIDICIYIYIRVGSSFLLLGGQHIYICIYIYTFGIQTKPWRNTLATLAISGSHWNSLDTFKARYFFFRLGFLLSEWSHLNTQIVILQKMSQNFIGFPSISHFNRCDLQSFSGNVGFTKNVIKIIPKENHHFFLGGMVEPIPGH